VEHDVDVRGGPSEKYDVTSRLAKGMTVRVLKEENNWLGIEPPPGSFGWIHNRLVRPSADGTLLVVLADQAPLRLGIKRDVAPNEIVTSQLERGTILTVVGRYLEVKSESPSESGKWWPVAPLNECRWVPREAVQLKPAVETTASAASPSTNPAPAHSPAQPESWSQAELAERQGDLPRAMQLYAATAAAATDHDLQTRCYNRIQFLRENNRGSAPVGYQPGRPSEAATGELRPMPAPVIPTSATTTTSTGPTTTGQAVSYTQQAVAQATNPGRLLRASFVIDGRQAYVLVDSQGRPQIYALAPLGQDLGPYVNRNVILHGQILYRGDLKTNTITVTQVTTLP
jgi:hypothetical protein